MARGFIDFFLDQRYEAVFHFHREPQGDVKVLHTLFTEAAIKKRFQFEILFIYFFLLYPFLTSLLTAARIRPSVMKTTVLPPMFPETCQ